MNEIHRQIKKSVEKLTKEKTKKSLMDNVKRLLKAASKFSNKAQYLSLQKILLNTYYLHYKNMPAYCLKCRRHTGNSDSKKVI